VAGELKKQSRNKLAAAQEPPGGFSGGDGLHDTGAQSFAALESDGSFLFAYPVAELCPVVPGERFQRPVGVGKHADRAIRPNQDGHFQTLLAMSGRGFGCLQDLARVIYEQAHETLIEKAGGD